MVHRLEESTPLKCATAVLALHRGVGSIRTGLMHTRRRHLPGLAQRIADLRRATRQSQQVCATRAGMSTNRLRDAERHGLATTETLTLLARVLGVAVDDLTGRSRP